MMRATIRGVGVLGCGLPGWTASRAILSGAESWVRRPVVVPSPAMLPATERRRTSPVVRLALAVASEAVAASGLLAGSLRCVFGTGNGDGATVTTVLDALTRPDGFVSPTLFHNSVHNSAAGYWSIGAASERPVTCLGCHDDTFGATLMKAMAECQVEAEPVLMVVYDAPFPAPLDAARPTGEPFGVALVLSPPGSGPGLTVGLTADWHSAAAATTSSRLHGLAANPAAHSLALLESLARGEPADLALALLDGHLAVTVTP